MDKYLMVIFGMMFVGMAIAFVSPSGEIRPQPFLALFYASLGGAIAVSYTHLTLPTILLV